MSEQNTIYNMIKVFNIEFKLKSSGEKIAYKTLKTPESLGRSPCGRFLVLPLSDGELEIAIDDISYISTKVTEVKEETKP